MGELEAGRELDALVAEKVMGWLPLGIGTKGITALGKGSLAAGWVGFWDGSWTRWTSMPEPTDDDEERATLWSPSTDIAAAWEVVESPACENGHKFQLWQEHGAWGARISGMYEADDCDTTPLAICRAALKAVEK